MSTVAKAFLTETQSARMDRIIEATLSLISTAGAERVTMRDIATASRVAAATLYNRFGTKDDLITAAAVSEFLRHRPVALERMAAARTPLQKIMGGLEAQVEAIAERPQLSIALVSSYYKLGNSRQMPDQLFDLMVERWLPVVEDMRHNNALRSWVSTPLLAEEMVERYLSVSMRWALQEFPLADLKNRMSYALAGVVLAASRGQQAEDAEKIMTKLSRHLLRRGKAAQDARRA